MRSHYQHSQKTWLASLAVLAIQAFTINDIGLEVEVIGSSIKIDGVLRSNIDASYVMNGLDAPNLCSNNSTDWHDSCFQAHLQGVCDSASWIEAEYCQKDCFLVGKGYRDLDCSIGWPHVGYYKGWVCQVNEAVGGLVMMDNTSSACKGNSDGQFMVLKNPAIYMLNAGSTLSSTG